MISSSLSTFFQTFRLMQFAGVTPPTYIIVLFVTFFPLQGFFNLVVYFFPRIMRYFEEGVPLHQSFARRSSFFSSFRASISKNRPSRKSSQTEVATGFSQEESGVGKASSAAYVSEAEGGLNEKRKSVSFAEGIVEDGEKGRHVLAMGVDDGDNKEEEGANEDNTIEEGTTDEDGRGDGEKDAIDELERIVEA